MEEEGLAAALELALDRPPHQVLVVGADVGADRAPPLRRGLDRRDVAQPRQAHLQGARDRRRRERQHVDLQLQLAQQLLLLDAEALLLVDDQEAEVLGADVAREQPVGADQDVDLARLEALQHLFHLRRLAQAGDPVEGEGEVGEALAEGAEVLLGEDRRRRQHHHLLAVGGGLDRRPQRHLGLAEADVAADQPVHRLLRFHVALDRLDRLQLVGGLAVGEGRLHRDLPLAVGREGVALAGAPLGEEVEQLAGQGAGRFAGARLHVLPAFAAERRERRLGARAGVAAQLRQLVGGDVDPVLALVFEVEVVAADAADLARLEPGEAGDAVVLVDDVVADAQVAEGEAALAGARRTLLGAPAPVDEAAERVDGEAQLGADEALAQARLGEGEARVRREAAAVEQGGVEAFEAVARALRLAAVVEGDDRAVAGADQFLQLALGLFDAARRRLGARGAERRLVVLAGAAHGEDRAGGERRRDLDVEVAGVVGVHRRGRVLPVVAQRRLDLLGGGEDHRRLLGHEVERGAEVLQRQNLGGARRLLPFFGRLHRRQLGQLAVLGVELGGGRQLDPLGVAERALGEGREPAHRLDLVAEELDPHGALLGRRIDVEDAAADGELAALLDLLDPLVAGGDQLARGGVELDFAARLEREAGGAQRGVRHRLGERGGAGDHNRVLLVAQRLQGVDPQADQMRGRGDVRGIAGAARGIEADPAGRKVGAQIGGEVAGRAIVGADEQGRPAGQTTVVLEQGRQQQRPQSGRGAELDGCAAARGAHLAGERVQALVLGGYLDQRMKAHGKRRARIERSGRGDRF